MSSHPRTESGWDRELLTLFLLTWCKCWRDVPVGRDEGEDKFDGGDEGTSDEPDVPEIRLDGNAPSDVLDLLCQLLAYLCDTLRLNLET